ncbi:hypothetical protein A2U01_0088013, partial [Trifolium medium]|nr:hypothetical protein [Trifolium medium]
MGRMIGNGGENSDMRFKVSGMRCLEGRQSSGADVL